MAGASAGSIQLDLELNRRGFDQQLNSLSSIAKKAGTALFAAFSVKKLVGFGKSCIELGSNLAEVQNVVDVTFTHMSDRVDKFAKDAAVNFGLSETMAKQYMGTIGAMSKSLGFSEKAAYEMSEGIASLAGDVASFYNISQDSAFDKLQSIFTGTIIPLREFGINMSQAALQEYALRNGITKSIDAMTEQERVMLRYRFVMDGLKGAQGDFLRTSDGWANQVRVLKLQFDSLKATIGQGLINVFLPVIKMINGLIGKLMSLANAFRAFTEMISGKKASAGASVAKAASDINDMAGAAGGAEDALGGTGNALKGAGDKAKKAAKDIANATAGIDELNIISKPEGAFGGSGSGGGAGGGGDYGADDFDMGKLAEGEGEVDGLSSKIKGLIDYVKELFGVFKEGFKVGLGDTSVFDSIKKSIESIGKSVKDIFLSPEVLSAADKFAKASAYSLGQMVGASVSIGLTVADNILGGISKYLEQNKKRIKSYFVNIFNIGTEVAKIRGDFATAVADIFTVFRGDNAKQLTANLIGIFASTFMGLTEIVAKFGRDLTNLMTAPVIENAEAIKDTLEGLVLSISNIYGTGKDVVDHFMGSLNKTYDAHVKPFVDSVAEGFTRIVGVLLKAYNDNIRPIMDLIGAKFGEFSEKHLKPLIDRFMEFAGKIIDVITKLWNSILAPFIAWFIENFGPTIKTALEGIINIFFALLGHITDVINGMITAYTGLVDFIVGVFTGNWALAWEGVKTIFYAVWEMMKDRLLALLDLMVGLILANLNNILARWTFAWNAVRDLAVTVWSYIKEYISRTFNSIKSFINEVLNAIQIAWMLTWTKIGEKLTATWNAMKEMISSTFSSIKSYIDNTLMSIKSAWSNAWEAIRNKASEVWSNIKMLISTAFNTIKTGIDTTLNSIKTAWSNVWTGVKSVTESTWNGIWGIIKGVINKIIAGVESMVNSVVRAINSMIEGINDVADNVPGIDGGIIPTLSEVRLPRLAQGGFVKANTPQLAIIGDNKYQGEVVAPEGKLQEMADRAARSNSNAGSSEQMDKMIDLMSTLVSLVGSMDLTLNLDVREFTQRQDELKNRLGYRMT